MLLHCSSHIYRITYRQLISNYHYTNNEKKRLTTYLDSVKMFTGQRRRGNVTRTRREPERNVPPGILEFSLVRFSSGSPPLPGSGLVQSSPLLSPHSVIPKLASCGAYQLHRERETGRAGSSESRSITNTGIYWRNIEVNWSRREPRPDNTDVEILRIECHQNLRLSKKIL